MHWRLVFILMSGISFIASAAFFLFVKLVLRPKRDDHWEQVHWEFEEADPVLRRYQFWNRAALAAVAVSMLLVLLSVAF